jgi:hypothetical protein
MKKLILTSTLAALVAGCSTTVNSTYTASGAPGYRIACGGFLGDGDLASCYQKAGEICASNGYKVLQTSLASLIIQCREAGDQGAAQ